MAKVPQMTTDFARWYSESFMEEGPKRDLRWKGVVDVASEANYETAEVLTRLAFQTPIPASGRKSESIGAAYAKVIEKISGGDAAFDPAHSGRELQILAAATLTRLFSSLPDAALVVTTASMAGLRKPDLPMDLAGFAEAALATFSARKHARISKAELKLATPTVDYALKDETLTTIAPEQVRAEFGRLHAATAAAIERVVAGQNRVVEALHSQLALDEEELQMLWWLLGGYSSSSDMPFVKVDEKLRPLVLAMELGKMTAVSPGPASIRAMLARAGIDAGELKLSDAVNAPDLGWVKSVSASALISPVTTPIHFALEQRAELGSTDTWQTSWSALTGVAADSKLPAVKLGELFYREHVFLNVSA